MSQLLAVVKAHVAYVVADTVMTEASSPVANGFIDKFMVLPRLNCVLASRGRAGFNQEFYKRQLCAWCVDFDDLTDRARLLMTRTLVELIKDGVPVEATVGQEALLVGYSARRRRIEAHGIKVHDVGISHDVLGEGVVAAPWDWQRYGMLKPKLNDPEKGMAALARQQFETMRRHVFEGEGLVVGGEMVMATIRRSGVSTTVIGRFANHDELIAEMTQREDYQAERAMAVEFDCDAPPNIVN